MNYDESKDYIDNIRRMTGVRFIEAHDTILAAERAAHEAVEADLRKRLAEVESDRDSWKRNWDVAVAAHEKTKRIVVVTENERNEAKSSLSAACVEVRRLEKRADSLQAEVDTLKAELAGALDQRDKIRGTLTRITNVIDRESHGDGAFNVCPGEATTWASILEDVVLKIRRLEKERDEAKANVDKWNLEVRRMKTTVEVLTFAANDRELLRKRVQDLEAELATAKWTAEECAETLADMVTRFRIMSQERDDAVKAAKAMREAIGSVGGDLLVMAGKEPLQSILSDRRWLSHERGVGDGD